MTEPEPLLTVRQVAKACQVSEATVRIWALAGRLKGVKTPGGAEWRFHRGDVAPFMSSPEEEI